jgi:hypothetical protein
MCYQRTFRRILPSYRHWSTSWDEGEIFEIERRWEWVDLRVSWDAGGMISVWVDLRVSWDQNETISTFSFPFLREVSHKSFVFTSSTFNFSGKSRTKASFSHLQFSVFEGSLAKKLRFHDQLRWNWIRWGEMRWGWLRWSEMKWAKMRWGQMKMSKDPTLRRWHRNDKSRDCCCEAQKACPHPIGTFFVSLYRL